MSDFSSMELRLTPLQAQIAGLESQIDLTNAAKVLADIVSRQPAEFIGENYRIRSHHILLVSSYVSWLEGMSYSHTWSNCVLFAFITCLFNMQDTTLDAKIKREYFGEKWEGWKARVTTMALQLWNANSNQVENLELSRAFDDVCRGCQIIDKTTTGAPHCSDYGPRDDDTIDDIALAHVIANHQDLIAGISAGFYTFLLQTPVTAKKLMEFYRQQQANLPAIPAPEFLPQLVAQHAILQIALRMAAKTETNYEVIRILVNVMIKVLAEDRLAIREEPIFNTIMPHMYSMIEGQNLRFGANFGGFEYWQSVNWAKEVKFKRLADDWQVLIPNRVIRQKQISDIQYWLTENYLER